MTIAKGATVLFTQRSGYNNPIGDRRFVATVLAVGPKLDSGKPAVSLMLINGRVLKGFVVHKDDIGKLTERWWTEK